MLHLQRFGPVHWPTVHLPAALPDRLLAIVVLVGVLVLVAELILLFGPELLDPARIPTPRVLPDPGYPHQYM